MKIRTRYIGAAVLAAFAVVAPLRASEAAHVESRKETNTSVVLPHVTGYAVYADTAEVTSDLQVTSIYPTDGEAQYGNCLYPVAAKVKPEGSAIVPRFGALLCGPRIGVTEVTAHNANVSTFVAWNGGARRTGYEIPLLTHRIGEGNGSEVRCVTNPEDGTYATSLLLFNLSGQPAAITARVYADDDPETYHDEQITATPRGALTWYDVKTKFASGRIVFLLDPAAEVYGFAAIGTPNGDAPRVRPIIERIVFPPSPRPNP